MAKFEPRFLPQSFNYESSNKVGYELGLGSIQNLGKDIFETRVRVSSNLGVEDLGIRSPSI